MMEINPLNGPQFIHPIKNNTPKKANVSQKDESSVDPSQKQQMQDEIQKLKGMIGDGVRPEKVQQGKELISSEISSEVIQKTANKMLDKFNI